MAEVPRSRPSRRSAPPWMRMALPSFVPLGKGDAAHFAAGGPGPTPALARHPSKEGISKEHCGT